MGERELGDAGLLPDRRRGTAAARGPALPDGALPRAGDHSAGPAVGPIGRAARAGRTGRRLDAAPPVRPPLESWTATPQRRARTPSQPRTPPARVQAGHL